MKSDDNKKSGEHLYYGGFASPIENQEPEDLALVVVEYLRPELN